MYDNASRTYNITRSLNKEQEHDFPTISKLLITLRQQIVPYPNEYFHGRGIVLTVGPHQLALARANLKMIEHSNTQLHVQIWYSSSQILEQMMMELLNNSPKLNSSICCFDTAQCRTRTQTWQLNPTHVYKPHIGTLLKSFPYKPAAIVSATFAEVLFLDSDAYITRDPIDLFLSDPMYLKFGALFFPDSFQSRQHPAVWNLFNTTCGEHEYELDSATILVDKKRVWIGLYMAKLMNDNYELFYKHVTDGDKDTFRLGFRYMDTGSFDGVRFCGCTLCKTDSLAQHIYVNHVHIIKYGGISYTPANLGYTRIGLGDPNNNSFLFVKCQAPGASRSCFHIVKKPNPNITDDQCYTVNEREIKTKLEKQIENPDEQLRNQTKRMKYYKKLLKEFHDKIANQDKRIGNLEETYYYAIKQELLKQHDVKHEIEKQSINYNDLLFKFEKMRQVDTMHIYIQRDGRRPSNVSFTKLRSL
ncbi:unnamed protein product [Rotaria sordida]|uniref:Uncharacterized protein n=1 Tax=Rotaria sordida TaxID=392033 RepID=A0A819JDA1_9BILA|nr:unnamed protein product [Rotaria sordida]